MIFRWKNLILFKIEFRRNNSVNENLQFKNALLREFVVDRSYKNDLNIKKLRLRKC